MSRGLAGGRPVLLPRSPPPPRERVLLPDGSPESSPPHLKALERTARGGALSATPPLGVSCDGPETGSVRWTPGAGLAGEELPPLGAAVLRLEWRTRVPGRGLNLPAGADLGAVCRSAQPFRARGQRASCRCGLRSAVAPLLQIWVLTGRLSEPEPLVRLVPSGPTS